ncbi:MAG: hypothetical protein AB7R69_06355, partial [Candidatus Babeliales bacterium]
QIRISGQTIQEMLQDNTIKPEDILLPIWAWSEDNPRFGWSDLIFPDFLPYNYLKGLKEGEKISLTIAGTPYQLTANQKEFPRNKPHNLFQEAHNASMIKFYEAPNFFSHDRKLLLEKKIIVPTEKINNIQFHGHGPNGVRKPILKQSSLYAAFGLFALSGLGLATWYYNPYAIVDTVKEFTYSCFDSFRNFNWWKK